MKSLQRPIESSWLRVVALSVLAALPACERGEAVVHPEVPGWTHRPSYAMSIVYRRDLLIESRRAGEPYERGRPSVDPEGRRVFVGSSDRGVYALGALDGDVLWRFETLGPVQAEPLLDAERDELYVGSNDGALYKLEASTGRLLWRFNTNAEVSRQPLLSGGRLFFVNANDTVIAVNPLTGKRLWSQHRTPALGMEIAGHAGLAVDDTRAYVAFSDGTVTAYDVQSGREVWDPVDLAAEAEQALGEAPKYLDVDTTPQLAEVQGVAAVVVGSYSGGITALRADNGNQIWSNPGVLSVTDVTLWLQPPHVDATDGQRYPARRHVIASTGTTGLWALDLDSGAEVWRRDLPDGGTSAPAFVSGAMLIGTTRQGLFLVSPIDGGVIDGIHTEAGFSMPPAALGQRAFVLSNSGEFLALAIAAPVGRQSRSWWDAAHEF